MLFAQGWVAATTPQSALAFDQLVDAANANPADEYTDIANPDLPVTLAECAPDSRINDIFNMMQAMQDYRLEENGAVLVLIWPAGGPEDVYRCSKIYT